MKLEEEQEIINLKALIEDYEEEIFNEYKSKLICKVTPSVINAVNQEASLHG